MLALPVPRNFDLPYTARSVSEFYRRWHITLGTWFRDYVYIPLGGSRNGNARTVLSLTVVWFFTGLWHGASWNFVLWGVMLLGFILLEKFCIGNFLKEHKVLSHVYLLFVIPQTWVIFRITRLKDVGAYFPACSRCSAHTAPSPRRMCSSCSRPTGGCCCSPSSSVCRSRAAFMKTPRQFTRPAPAVSALLGVRVLHRHLVGQRLPLFPFLRRPFMSSRPFFLLPLCFVSALALNAYAALDPTGVYQDYLEKLDAATPPVAAMATAAADGSTRGASPKRPNLLPSQTPLRFRTRNRSPNRKSPTPPSPRWTRATLTTRCSSATRTPTASRTMRASITPTTSAQRPDGLVGGRKGGVPGKQTLAQALSGKHYGKIYLMLGINELGTGTAESWAAQYKVLLDEVRELQPDAIIFCRPSSTRRRKSPTRRSLRIRPSTHATPSSKSSPTTKRSSTSTAIPLRRLYGALTPEYSGDGVHVKAAYYPMWRDYLFQLAS